MNLLKMANESKESPFLKLDNNKAQTSSYNEKSVPAADLSHLQILHKIEEVKQLYKQVKNV